jgi:hypothetical protein
MQVSDTAITAIRTDNGATGAALQMTHLSESPAAEDAVGLVKFVGVDEDGLTQEYAQISGTIENPVDAAEAGSIQLKVAILGTVTEIAEINGTGLVMATDMSITSSATNSLVPFAICVAQENITTNGAVSVGRHLTTIDSTAGALALNLASGVVTGQLKKILFTVDNGDAVITGAFTGDNNTLTFANAGEYALLQWNGTDWIALELSSVLNMTHAPVISQV